MEAAAKESIILSSSIFGKTRSRYDCTIAYNVTRRCEGRTDSKPSFNVLNFDIRHALSKDCIIVAVLK